LRRTETPSKAPVTLVAGGPWLSGDLKFRFDTDWNLLSGGFEMPPQRVRRTALSWPQVTLDFAPRKDFGGT
jgi:hypothetical protein